MTNKPQFVGERVRLGDIVTAASERNKNSHCNAVYSVTNSQGFIPSEDYFSKEVFSKDLKTYRVVRRNMIAYNPSRINVGSVALQDKEDEVVVSPLYVVFSADERKVLPDYLVRFLKSKPGLDQIAYQSIGTVRNNLKFNALCQIELRLPPLEIQQRRLFNLSSIHRQIDISSRRLFQLDSLVKSRFVEMFGERPGYATVPLQSCVDRIESGKSPNCLSMPRRNLEPAVLKLSAISSGIYRENENKALPSGTALATDKIVQNGDILLARKNTPELVGRSVLVGHTDGNIMFPDIIFRMRPTHLVDGLYLSTLLAGPLYESIKLLSHGSAKSMSNIPKSELALLPIPLPPLALQQEFAAFVAQVDKSRFAYIWNRTKSVGRTLSGPSLTLAIQHVEPQTRSKYWADASTPPFWLSFGAALVQKTPRVCVLIPTGQIGAIWCNSSTWGNAWNGWQSTHLLRIKTQTCPIFWRGLRRNARSSPRSSRVIPKHR